jgi:uncharacterized protein YycO
MKKGLIVWLLVCLAIIAGATLLFNKLDNGNAVTASNLPPHVFHSGDLIFQSSLSAQSIAIKLATHSNYSHCGIIYSENNTYYVLEAVSPVKITPLNEWASRGEKERFVVKRLKNASVLLNDSNLSKLKSEAEKFMGKPYDIYFEWSDEKIYCSELIWKVFHNALNIDFCPTRKLKSFDLSAPQVQALMYNRYQNNIPLNETVVAPVDIFQSPLLETIYANGEVIKN